MADKLFIPVLIGTTREQRKSALAAKLIYDVSKEYGSVESILVDPKDYNFPGDGNDPEGKDPKYTDITLRADGFFIVTPEYNHSFPGSLKRMLDSELSNYVHKAVAFAGASSGSWGGVRAIEALVVSVREMGLVATFQDIQFPRVQELFSEDGNLLDDKYIPRIRKAWDELIWLSTALKNARNISNN